jgi:hypothetical protein
MPLRSTAYSDQELLFVTNALKLSAKVYESKSCAATGVDSPRTSPFPHLVEIGLRLLARGAPPRAVIAGFFHEALARDCTGALSATLDRKFAGVGGAGEILPLARSCMMKFVGDEAWRTRKEAVVTSLSNAGKDEHIRWMPYDSQDVDFIVRAFWAAETLFGGVRRKWGPHETLPMLRHAAEAGVLLLGAGLDSSIVAAGLMHDFYEGYVDGRTRRDLENSVRHSFGDHVHELIAAVTEPAKSSEGENWFRRKMAVVEQLEKAGNAANCVACAAKISTIAEGNKFLYAGGRASEWLAGSDVENLRMFRLLKQLFETKGVPMCLTARLDLEISRWAASCCGGYSG